MKNGKDILKYADRYWKRHPEEKEIFELFQTSEKEYYEALRHMGILPFEDLRLEPSNSAEVQFESDSPAVVLKGVR